MGVNILPLEVTVSLYSTRNDLRWETVALNELDNKVFLYNKYAYNRE